MGVAVTAIAVIEVAVGVVIVDTGDAVGTVVASGVRSEGRVRRDR